MADLVLQQLQDFTDILKGNEPLAPYTYLKVGGPAEVLAQPRSQDELADLVRRCHQRRIPYRILGAGCNLLVRDEGVRGVVVRLAEPAFTQIEVLGRRVRGGSGAPLSAVISECARHGLAGIETLVGIPGTLGGVLRHSAGDEAAELGQHVLRVEVFDSDGHLQVRERDELGPSYRFSNPDDPVLLAVELELEPDSADAIVKRMRKAWILRKASRPFSFQAAARIFRDPRGLDAAELIEQAGLRGQKVGGAEVSDRHPNYIIAHSGATARDVLRLIDLVRQRVLERFNVDLELEIAVW